MVNPGNPISNVVKGFVIMVFNRFYDIGWAEISIAIDKIKPCVDL
jgi:hypothetical protein